MQGRSRLRLINGGHSLGIKEQRGRWTCHRGLMATEVRRWKFTPCTHHACPSAGMKCCLFWLVRLRRIWLLGPSSPAHSTTSPQLPARCFFTPQWALTGLCCVHCVLQALERSSKWQPPGLSVWELQGFLDCFFGSLVPVLISVCPPAQGTLKGSRLLSSASHLSHVVRQWKTADNFNNLTPVASAADQAFFCKRN